jgi:hypothetical protein
VSSGSKWAPMITCRSRSGVANSLHALRRCCDAGGASAPSSTSPGGLGAIGSTGGFSILALGNSYATTVSLSLSSGEYDLLLALVERPHRVLSREQLLDLARGRAATAFDRSIDTQVSRLRKKIELDPGDPKIIKTVWGGGYMLTATVSVE